MKTNVLLTLLSIICFYSVTSAKIYRLGYPGAPVAGVDYATFAPLQTAAAAGDTVQVYGSHPQIIVTKSLVFIGFGYNLDVNAGLQVNNLDNPSYFSSAYLRAGSDGTKMEGISIGTLFIGNDNNSPAGAGVSNITLNRIKTYVYLYTTYSSVTNLTINSSVLEYVNNGSLGTGSVVNLSVNNSIIRYYVALRNFGSSGSFINCVSPAANQGGYNTFDLENASCLVKNCITQKSGAASNPNTVYENNFFEENMPAVTIAGTNNHWSQSYAALFQKINGLGDQAGVMSSADFREAYYALKAGSPAINGGFNGGGSPTDCGIFGGEAAYLYKLSGIPAIPAIYRLDAPSLNTSTNPYNVTISIRSNN